jgi:rhodanese-related sulfurtransferase
MLRVLFEGVLVAIVGVSFALAANAISPRGLSLTRNYFPGAVRPAGVLPARTYQPQSLPGASTNTSSSEDVVAARLKAEGLQLVDKNQVLKLFRDPRYQQELVVFIDARDDQHYQDGHIPGAYQLDHYHPENYLAMVLPVCQTADQIVVYCHGGSCEDSEFTAITLSDTGVAKSKLSVYGGGFAEWMALGQPVETGARNSGDLRTGKAQK